MHWEYELLTGVTAPGDVVVFPLPSSDQSGLHQSVPPPQVKRVSCHVTEQNRAVRITGVRNVVQTSAPAMGTRAE